MKIALALVAGLMAGGTGITGCVTTGNTMSDAEVLAEVPSTGIEAIAGRWGGTWTVGNSYSTLQVRTDDAGKIDVRYCSGGWCAFGCSESPCSKSANRLRNVRFEDDTLKYDMKSSKVTYKREGGRLRGKIDSKYGDYYTLMRRKAE